MANLKLARIFYGLARLLPAKAGTQGEAIRLSNELYTRVVHATTQITIAQVWEKGPHPLSSLARRLGFTAIQSKLCIL